MQLLCTVVTVLVTLVDFMKYYFVKQFGDVNNIMEWSWFMEIFAQLNLSK